MSKFIFCCASAQCFVNIPLLSSQKASRIYIRHFGHTARSLGLIFTNQHVDISHQKLKTDLRLVRHFSVFNKSQGCKWNHVDFNTLSRQCSTSQPKSTCWKCQGPLLDHTEPADHPADVFHCPHCGVLQPPATNLNYFELLGFGTHYDIDTKLLTSKYRKIQSRLHPDKAARLPQIEQEYADQQSTLVNKAYDALLKPVPRALYMLKLHGFSLEERDIQLAGDFLMDVMDINEEIADTDDSDELRVIFDENRIKIEDLIKKISDCFSDKDYQQAKYYIAKIKYFVNIEDKIKSKTFLH